MPDVRLIDANALKSLLIEVLERIKENPKMTKDEMHIISGCHMLCEMIDDAPTIEAAPVVHGRWEGLEGLNCSVCGESYMEFAEGCSYPVYRENRLCTPPYCPNCGAKMDGGAE